MLRKRLTKEEAEAQFDAEARKRVKIIGFLLGFAIGIVPVGVFALLGYYYQNKWTKTGEGSAEKSKISVSPTATAECETKFASSKRQMYNFFSDVVEEVAPGIVCIEVTGIHQIFGTSGVFFKSHGSGFVVRKDGLVMTNAHVVGGRENNKVTVRSHNGKTYTGTVIATDVASDLALVKLQNAKNMHALKLGESKDVKTGEFVMALGSPFSEELSNTLTTGVISNTRRRLGDLQPRMIRNKIEYLQTDAAIHSGNSGGPLINLDGEVIGITSMQVTSGISFAIPSDYAKIFLDRNSGNKLQKEPVESKVKLGSSRVSGQPAFLGVSMLELDEAIVRELKSRNYGFPDVSFGVLIHSVVLGSPAHRAGIHPGDVVTHINGKEVRTGGEVMAFLSRAEELQFTVVRSDGVSKITVVPE